MLNNYKLIKKTAIRHIAVFIKWKNKYLINHY
jgi:hypothetical protein